MTPLLFIVKCSLIYNSQSKLMKWLQNQDNNMYKRILYFLHQISKFSVNSNHIINTLDPAFQE